MSNNIVTRSFHDALDRLVQLVGQERANEAVNLGQRVVSEAHVAINTARENVADFISPDDRAAIVAENAELKAELAAVKAAVHVAAPAPAASNPAAELTPPPAV